MHIPTWNLHTSASTWIASGTLQAEGVVARLGAHLVEQFRISGGTDPGDVGLEGCCE